MTEFVYNVCFPVLLISITILVAALVVGVIALLVAMVLETFSK